MQDRFSTYSRQFKELLLYLALFFVSFAAEMDFALGLRKAISTLLLVKKLGGGFSLPYCWIVQDRLSMMMYTGAPRRAFQLSVAHEVEPKACTRRILAAAIWPMCDLGACRLASAPSLAYLLSTSA